MWFVWCARLQCDAAGPVFTGKTWVARVSFVVYIMAIQSVMGERQQLLVVLTRHSAPAQQQLRCQQHATR